MFLLLAAEGAPESVPVVLEIIGYASSVLIAVSLMMSNIYKLRIINLIGAAIFATYGALIGAIPVAVVNGFIAIIDIYYLVIMSRRNIYYRTLDISANAPFLKYFLQFYENDVQNFFPGFSWSKELKRIPSCVFLLRNAAPAGVFIYTIKRKTAVVKLDYVVPEYRDMKNARYLFLVLSACLRNNGINEFVVENVTVEKHHDYLLSLGFKQDPKRETIMRMPII